MTPLGAHAACALLVAADLASRTARLRWLVRGAGSSLGWLDALRVNALADAGATLTPLRLGGEPARVVGMRLAGVPLPVVGVAIGYELITAWPVLLALGGALFATLAPEWWRSAVPGFVALTRERGPWLVALVALLVAALLAGRALRKRLPPGLHAGLGAIADSWRCMPRWPVLLSLPLSAINVVSRVALLPVLAMTLPDPPSFAALWVGSFLLVYGQLVLPTPAGAGAVDLGLLDGAAGNLGGDAGALLLAWRWWANGASTVLGVGFAVALLRRGHRTVTDAATFTRRS